jgi:hypothetical protein
LVDPSDLEAFLDGAAPPKKREDAPTHKKRQYNFSKAELARRETQSKLRQAKKQKVKFDKAAKKEYDKIRHLEKGAKKVEKAINKKGPALIVKDEIEELPKYARDYVEDNAAFKPHPGPQTDFLASPEEDVLYGGAAGGGKSFAVLLDVLRYADNTNHRAIILRRTLDELRELIEKSHQVYPIAFPKAQWREGKNTWFFPSGASVHFSYCDRDRDVTRYQGQSYTYIAIDEITHYPTPYVWDYLRSRLRTTDPSIIPYMRCCIDEGEVLTVSGWKSIQDVEKGELVHSVEKNGELVVKPVTSVTSFEVNEEITRIRKKNLYMSMTNDHRVLYKKHGKPTNELIRWNEYVGGSINVVRTSEKYDAAGFEAFGKFDDNAAAQFLGLYIAEGCFGKTRRGSYKVIITQNKIENHPFIRELLSCYNFCYCKNGDFQITNKELWGYVKQFGKSKDKHFPREFLKSATYEQLDLAFKAYILGDGNWQSDTSCTAYTTSPQLVNDLQEIAVKLGYKTQYKKYELDNPNHNDKYCVYFTKDSPTTKVDIDVRNDATLEHYTGKVYCITVEDTENFILRQKNHVWVSGNTANPGGIGGWWVKKMYIDPSPPNHAFPAVDIESGATLLFPPSHANAGKPLFYRKFIPARLTDNPSLMSTGDYEAMLMSLPEVERRRLLEGDWDVAEGAAFTEFDRNVHVCDPFELPKSWTRIRACDYGYASPSCVLWGAVDFDGNIWVYRELYGKGWNAERLADLIIEMEAGDPYIQDYVLDGSCWDMRGQTGPSIAEVMVQRGVKWRRADKNRLAGKLETHRRLQASSEEGNGVVLFSNCVNTIRSMPTIPLCKNNPEDVDTKAEDHAYDALRYMFMSRPRAARDLIQDFRVSQSRQPPPMVDATFGY